MSTQGWSTFLRLSPSGASWEEAVGWISLDLVYSCAASVGCWVALRALVHTCSVLEESYRLMIDLIG